MIVGIMVVDLFAETPQSLKDKRYFVSSIKQKLRNKFNVSVIESDFQDLWQKIQFAIVTVAHNKSDAVKSFQSVEEFIYLNYPVKVIDIKRDFL